MDVNWIRGALERQPDKTQRGLADALGIDPSAVSKMLSGTRQLKANEIEPAARYLGVRPPPVALTIEATNGNVDNQGQRFAPVGVPVTGGLRKDIPVLGTVVGGTVGDFIMSGEIVDHVRRPPGIADAKHVYALYIEGDSMAPRYDPGDLIYVNLSRPARPGDDVVVEMHPDPKTGSVSAYVKRLAARTPTMLVCRQFNPEREIEYPLAKIHRIGRVMRTHELYGV